MENSHTLSSRRNVVTSPLVLPTCVASAPKVASSALDDAAPPSAGASAQPDPSLSSTSSRHGISTGNDQMYIKRHVRRRLANAKENCDKELKNIINSITIYVEERLQEMDCDELGSTIAPSETGSDDGGTEADLDIPTSKHSRHRAFTSSTLSNDFFVITATPSLCFPRNFPSFDFAFCIGQHRNCVSFYRELEP